MLIPDSIESAKLLVHTAKLHAVAGAAMGVTLGILRGVVQPRRAPVRDGYDVVIERVTQAGAGAILGLVGGTAGAVTGMSVAAVAGRGILVVAIPMVVSVLVTTGAHERVVRIVRPWSMSAVNALRRRSADRESSPELLHLPSPNPAL